MEILLTPPLAFIIYIPLVLVIYWIGKKLAGPEKENAVKSSAYGSGEEAPTTLAAPGYKPFFVIALFFAVLHLGVLVLGLGSFTPAVAPFLVGLMLALIALLLG
jgi:NADH:ubiquinone oxidoreductase subunit 3 (subunit A)